MKTEQRNKGKGGSDSVKCHDAKACVEVCPYAKKCGGCTLQGVPYMEQLRIKEQEVRKLFKGICDTAPIVGMENPKNYRNKVHAVLKRKRDGSIISGVYEAGTHRVIPVDSCMIEDEKADAIIRDIRDLCKSFKIKIYSEDSGYGLLRHILIRRGFASGEIMVVLVASSPVFPSKNNFVKALRDRHPEITTVVLNVNDRQTSMVLGTRDIVLYGKGFIMDSLCGCQFKISPQSFYQVNPIQTEKLYTKAVELAALSGKERIIDAYCGIGTIGLIASRNAKEVIGIELNKEAVKDAIANAKLNHNKKARFFTGDAGEFMLSLASEGEKADVVFMDPPRSGSDEKFLSSVAVLNPEKVVYISCNPETMVRDILFLKKKGYRAGKVYLYDLFPFTGHVECVVLMSRLRSK